jgi:hypothetical protein
MDPLTLALIGGNVVGGLLSSNEQRKQRAHEMRMKAAEIENQPYMKKDVQKTQVTTQAPSIWASMLGGGLSGLSQAQALQRAEAAQTLAEAQAAALQKGSLPAPMAMDPELDYEQMNQSYPTNNSYSYFQGQGPSMWNRMSYNPTLMGR